MSKVRKARPGRNGGEPASKLGFCHPCGKQTFSARKVARADAKRSFPKERLNAFPCPHGRGWHYGHLKEGDRS